MVCREAFSLDLVGDSPCSLVGSESKVHGNPEEFDSLSQRKPRLALIPTITWPACSNILGVEKESKNSTYMRLTSSKRRFSMVNWRASKRFYLWLILSCQEPALLIQSKPFA